MRPVYPPQRRFQAGFTLIEIVATLMIFGILGLFGSFMLAKALQSTIHVQNNAHQLQKAQIALMRMTTELTSIQFFTCDALSNTVEYRTCEDQDRSFYLDGEELKYRWGSNSETLADHVLGFTVDSACRIDLTMRFGSAVEQKFSTRIQPFTVCPHTSSG